DDLRRFLAGESILARRVGPVERAVKWVRRNPVVAGLLAAGVLVGVLGFATTYLQYLDAEEQRGQAETQAGTARLETKKSDEALARANALGQSLARTLYENGIALARRTADDSHLGRAMAVLDSCPLALRGWEHRHLSLRCRLGVRVLEGGAEDLTCVS